MIPDDAMEAFLREGLKSYPEAREAVDTYEQEIQNRLATLLETTDWTSFKPKRGERGRGKAVSMWADRSADGRYVSANQNSEDNTTVIDLGFLWGSSKAKDGVVMYCGFWQGGQVRTPQLATPVPPVRCEPIGRNRARLFVVVDGQFDLESPGRLLLAEMNRALEAMVPAP